MDVYEEHLTMWLFEESKPITCTFVAHELGVATYVAKKMMYDFAQKNEARVRVSYLVSGIVVGGSHSVVLTDSMSLAAVESTFETVYSVHVYSLVERSPASSSKHPPDLLAKEIWRQESLQRTKLIFHSEEHQEDFKTNAASSIRNKVGNGYSAMRGGSADVVVSGEARSTGRSYSGAKISSVAKKPEVKTNMTASNFFSRSKPKIVVAPPPSPSEDANVMKEKKRRVVIDSDDDDDADDPFAPKSSTTSVPPPAPAASTPAVVEERSAPEQSAPKTKKYKKVLREKSYQNEKGYFVSEQVWEEVTDDEADVVKPIEKSSSFKRKHPVASATKKTASGKGGLQKKQKGIMGFFGGGKKS
eukprot:Stramenopile-MAST_4_protein_4998